ncbi:hypothetical protein V6N13_140856 [Hibiscus sabdariffa]|uniref:Uncharacterized protein n=1 Tax=Hibiscus sabdariffa TaxID=183260 RepID=A0ABR2Q1N8_9ROSI
MPFTWLSLFYHQELSSAQFPQKLCRFEKLGELDPMELEKRMLERERDDESFSSQSEMNIGDYNLKSVPDCMKRLVSHLMAEEETGSDASTNKRRRKGYAKGWMHGKMWSRTPLI